jgi:hypothetical protein
MNIKINLIISVDDFESLVSFLVTKWDYVRDLELVSHRCGPGFETASVMRNFVVDRVALG